MSDHYLAIDCESCKESIGTFLLGQKDISSFWNGLRNEAKNSLLNKEKRKCFVNYWTKVDFGLIDNYGTDAVIKFAEELSKHLDCDLSIRIIGEYEYCTSSIKPAFNED